MNLDNLISKYLDGELSRSEDAQLRDILSNDMSAREEFDAHVLIHAAMKEDARSIKPSLNLVGSTEDKILSRIMAEQPFEGTIFKQRRRKPVMAFASLLVLLLIFSIFSIMDYNFIIGNDIISDALDAEKDRINRMSNLQEIGLSEELISEPSEFEITEPINNDIFAASIQSVNSRASSNLSSANMSMSVSDNINSEYFEASETSSGRAVDILSNIEDTYEFASDRTDNADIVIDFNSVESTIPVERIEVDYAPKLLPSTFDAAIVDKNSVTEAIRDLELPISSNNDFAALNKSLNSQSNSMNQRYNIGIENYDLFYGQPSQINLNTFFGSQIVQGGFGTTTPEVLSNFSQSLGYAINEKQQFGLEIGYTKYAYDETKIGKIPNLVNAESDYIELNNVEVREGGSGSPGYIEFPYTITTEQQMMWGAAYFDQQIFNTGKFSLSGRLSLGATNKGPLGYGRVYAQYNLWNWFSFNLGADGKAFWWDNPAFGENSNKVKTSLSIIYGFEIRI